METNKISLADHLIAGALSALMMAIMALGIPIVLAVLSRGRGLEILGVFGTFHTWGAAVVAVAGLAGVALGSERVVVLFAHLWGTERPQKIWLTLSLWTAVIGIAGVSYWFFGQHHAL